MRLPKLIVALIQTASFYLGGFDPDDPLPTDLRVDMTFIPGGAKSMIVRVQITNEGSQLYRVLESPTSLIDQPDPVDKYGADKFYPARKDDPEKEPEFLGAAYKWSPEDAALEGQYTIFGSGAMKTYDYELSDLYDFSKSGPGDYVLTPNPYILLLDLDGNIEEGAYKVPPQLEFTIPPSYWDAGSDQQVVRTSTRNVTAETQAFHSCDNACPTRNNCLGKIQVAAAGAVNIAQDAKAHLDANYNGWSVRLRNWFGVRTPRRAQTVRQTVNNLVAEDFTIYTWVCDCQHRGSVYAYILREEYPLVHICPAFWRAGHNGANSRAGVIYHEGSHFYHVGHTSDHTYGVRFCLRMARREPNRAVRNADSYEYYAENPYVA